VKVSGMPDKIENASKRGPTQEKKKKRVCTEEVKIHHFTIRYVLSGTG